MTADVSPSHVQSGNVKENWCSWSLRDIALGLALLLFWRLLPVLKPSPLAMLPAPAQGAVLLFGPQLSYVFFPLTILYLRRDGFGDRFHGIRQLAREVLISVGVLSLLVAIGFVIATAIKILSPGATLIPETYIRRAAQFGNSSLVWVLLASSVLIAPLSEETFFRGFLQQAFRARVPLIAASLVQSALFTLMHGFDAILTPGSMFVGLILTCVYEWRRTLIAPIVLHMGINLACSILFLFVVHSHNNRPMLGISAYDIAGPCRVRLVVPDSAAAQGGMRKEDLITAFDGEQVESFPHLLQLIAKHDIGESVGVSVRRDGASIELQITLQPPTTKSQ